MSIEIPSICEVVADIAFACGVRAQKTNRFPEDSRELMRDIGIWAKQFEDVFFEAVHGDDYMELVDEYSWHRLNGNHGKAEELLKEMQDKKDRATCNLYEIIRHGIPLNDAQKVSLTRLLALGCRSENKQAIIRKIDNNLTATWNKRCALFERIQLRGDTFNFASIQHYTPEMREIREAFLRG